MATAFDTVRTTLRTIASETYVDLPAGVGYSIGGGIVIAHDGSIAGKRSLQSFGAVGDGTTDDTDAINEAFASGFSLDGGRLEYGVTDQLDDGPGGVQLSNFTLKDLTPGGVSRKVLRFVDQDGVGLDNVKVNRNGNGTGGSFGNSGIHILRGSGHCLVKVEAYGDDKGNGIMIEDADDFDIYGAYAHDINYDATGATDDLIQGIYLTQCSRFRVYSLRAADLGGNPGGVASTRYTRGLAVNGCRNGHFYGTSVKDVDQGIDMTGGFGNYDLTFHGGDSTDCYSYNMKIANSQVGIRVNGFTGKNAGRACFEVQGTVDPAATIWPVDIIFTACIAENPGYIDHGGIHAGWHVDIGSTFTAYPAGVKINDCIAKDTQGVATMTHGFVNGVSFTGGVQNRFNQVNNCYAYGYTSAAFDGFGTVSCTRVGTGTQAVTSGTTPAAIDLVTVSYDPYGMGTGSNSTITPLPFSTYLLTFDIAFAAQAGGYRRVGIYVAGSLVKAFNESPGSDVATVSGQYILRMNTASSVDLRASQNSGSSINIDLANSNFSLTRLSSP